jgi:predicted RNA-binding protein with PUA-like domain
MNHWLIKSEPANYSWSLFEEEGHTFWNGVRNYQARNNLRLMKKGDLCLFYHSNEDKAVMGIARVIREFYQDPTTEDANWVCVDVEPLQRLKTPVTLDAIKSDARLSQIALVRQGRLSVMPLKKAEFDAILEISGN